MRRLSLLDSQFLHLEDHLAPMHIGVTCIFEGAFPGPEAFRAHVLSKLDRIPRYRQRLCMPPMELGRPVWVDDVDFYLDLHLNCVALPAPGEPQDLSDLVGRVMSATLDRSRPLWELWTVEGLGDNRWALIAKVHHSMVDGVSGVDLLTALLDTSPTPASSEAPAAAWHPDEEPAPGSMVQDAWQGLAADVSRFSHKLREGLDNPDSLADAVVDTGLGLLHWAQNLTPTGPLPINGVVGSKRAYAFHESSRHKLSAIRKATGSTLNDVILAAVAGGYRQFLLQRGETLDAETQLRTIVPVSVRRADQHDQMDNRVSAILCELPIAEADPVQRLRTVCERMREHKASHMAEAGDWLMDVGNLAPPMVVGAITRLVTRVMHSLPQRALNTVTTNVPGPPMPLYLLGSRQLSALPYVPIHQGVRTGVAALTYDGKIAFGVTTDYESIPEAKLLADAIGAEVDVLLHAVAADDAETKSFGTHAPEMPTAGAVVPPT